MRAVVGAVVGAEGLVLAVDGIGEAAQQHVVAVAGEQRVPVRTPDHLDHVPAGAAEQRLQLLDDLPVAAHRAVQALQVAVDDEGQVVELLARGQRQRGDGFRLVHLAVAEHAPDVALAGVGDAAVLQVAEEARLVDGADRADAHGTGGELPEVRHQPRMRVGTEAAAVHFLAVALQLLFAQAAFEEGAGVDAGGRVRLEVHQVALAGFAVGAEEVVEADFEDFRRRSVAGDMAAQFAIGLVSPRHHGQGVPADDRGDALFHRQVAGEGRLVFHGDAVLVQRIGMRRRAHAEVAGVLGQALQEKLDALAAGAARHGLQGVEPFVGFLAVDVVAGPGGRRIARHFRNLGCHGYRSNAFLGHAPARDARGAPVREAVRSVSPGDGAHQPSAQPFHSAPGERACIWW
ncbi:hypothetical protein D9M71_72400 [compost metagenome]